MVQILEQPDIAETLGRGLGSGLSTGLSLLMQARIQGLQRQQQLKDSFSKIPKDVDSYLKAVGASESFDTEDRLKFIKNVREKISSGRDPHEAMEETFTEIQDEEPPPQKGGLAQLLSRHVKEASESQKQDRQKAFDEGPSIVKHPMQALYGLTESPVLNLLRASASPEMTAIELLQKGTKGIGKPAFEYPQEELSEKQKKTRELGKELGDFIGLSFIPFFELLGPIKKPLSRLLGRVSSKLRANPEEVGKAFTEFAKKEGIDFTKLSQKDATESKKLAKVMRSFEENVSPIGKELKVSEELEKAKPRLTSELEAEKVRREPKPKTERAKAKEEALKIEGKKELPAAQRRYDSIKKHVGEVKDSLKAKERKYLPGDLKKAIVLEQEGAEDLLQAHYKHSYGKVPTNPRQLRLQIHDTLENVKSASPSEFASLKERFQFKDPKKVAELEAAVRRKPLPNVKPRSFVDINQKYADAIADRLTKIDKALEKASFSEVMSLNQERNRLLELLEIQKKKLVLGNRRNALHRINKTIETQKKISKEISDQGDLIEKIVYSFDDNLGRVPKEKISKILKESPIKKRFRIRLDPLNPILKGLRKKGVDIDRRSLRTLLTSVGIGTGAFTGPGLIRSITSFRRTEKMRRIIKHGSRKELHSYIEKLKRNGISKAKITKELKRARKKTTS